MATVFEIKRELPDDENIHRLAKHANHMHQRWQEVEVQLQEAIRILQTNCGDSGHDFEVEKQGRPGEEVYVGKVCQKCKLFISRNPGPRWKVCEKCGGEMKAADPIASLGGHIFIYICKNCGHEHKHT